MSNYKQNIDQYDVISFDVFDTLLARNVAAPVDVFTITQELFNQKSNFTLQDDFRSLRIRAERNARLGKVSADVTLDDIYDNLKLLRADYTDQFIEGLKNAELQAEAEVLVRGKAAELYDYAVKQGKKIAIVSDMYLPKEAIAGYLKQNGISHIGFFLVSCEDHVSKASGTAFVALQEKFEGQKVLHIGDNYHDDIVMARRYGLSAVHIKNNIELMRDKGIVSRFKSVVERRLQVPEQTYLGQVTQSVVDGIVANYIINNNANNNTAIGFTVLGPLLLGYSQWLHESLLGDSCDRVLFLARDGNIMYKAYNLLYGDKAVSNEYIFGSRRALVFPSLRVLSGDDIRTFAQLDRGASLRATLETFNLDKDSPLVVKAAKSSGVNLNNDEINGTNSANFEAMLLTLKDDILDTIESERGVVLDYLKSVGFSDTKAKIAVCDIGWNGSVRAVIEDYVGREVPGYYLGLRNVEKTRLIGSKISGYFDARKEFDWKEFAPVVAGGVEVIEFLFSNPDQGPIKRIEKNKDGTFSAPQNKHDFPEDRRQMVRDIQSAALEFIRQFQSAARKLPDSLFLLDRHTIERS